MATKLNRERMRAARAPAVGKQAAAPRRREARESGRETPESAREAHRPEGRPRIHRFDLADIKSIAIERNSPLCLVIVVNPPKQG